MTKRAAAIRWIISGIITVGLIWGALHWQDLRDKAVLASYHPDAEIEAIANRTTMTEKARTIFYATNPTIDEREVFNSECPQKEAGLNVLGCYQGSPFTPGKIGLFRIDDKRLADEIDVTAAHEMLHAAYQHLNLWERQRVNKLIQEVVTKPGAKYSSVVQGYIKDQNWNELHSHIGTEFEATQISSELTDYYNQYFTDRLKIVAVHLQNDALFDECERDGKSQRTRIESSKALIDSYRAQLDAMRAQMDKDLNEGDTESYNQQVPQYNRLVQLHNSAVSSYNAKLVTYQSLVDRCNALNLSIDSHLQPIHSAPSR